MIATKLQRQPSRDAKDKYNASHSQTGDALIFPPSLQSNAILSITTSQGVWQALSQNAQYAAFLDVHLKGLLEQSKVHIQSSQNLLHSLGQQVHLIEDEAKVLERRLKETGLTAERISESVRRLDTEKDRVEKARLWTEMVSNLKASLQSLASAIHQEDYHAATQYCIRALAIDPEVLHSNFAATMVPSSEYPQPPSTQLDNSRKTLLNIYTKNFEAATDAKDTVEATKYFKMFPLIGWKEEGLAVYREYAKSVVRERGRVITDELTTTHQKDGPTHAALLTKLFEHLALLIDQHQPLVDRFYGAGNFARSVMPGLQDECDRLGRRVCDAWYEEFNVQRKIEEAKSHIFTYVGSIGNSGKNPPNRSNTANQRGAGGFSIPGRPSTPSVIANENQEGETEVETRAVDKILGELAVMAGRWGTYRVFLNTRLALINKDNDEKADEIKDFRKSTTSSAISSFQQSDERELQLQDSGDIITSKSQLGKRIISLIEEVYIPLESWFLRCSIEKAHRMDTIDKSTRPLISSMLDDIFYLVRMVLARSISTANIEVLSGMCRNLRYIIDEDFVQALVRKMDGVWKGSSMSMNVEGPRKDAASREIRSTFVVYLNVLATSADYMSRIVTELSSEQNLSKHYVDKEISMVISTIQGLSILIPRIRNAVRTHLELLYTTLIKPKLKQVLSDCLRETSYLLNEEDFARLEQEGGATSNLVKRFTRGWETIFSLGNYRQVLLSENWESLLRLAIDSVVQGWEDWALNTKYTELGALYFDKDIRSLISYLSSQSTLGGLRDRFTRLTQISYFVNLDEDAAHEQKLTQGDATEMMINGNGRDQDDSQLTWRLSPQEINRVRQRRVIA